jgi:hypothetical protein
MGKTICRTDRKEIEIQNERTQKKGLLVSTIPYLATHTGTAKYQLLKK